ncbi:hypothetical protein MLD38_025736 [Melastoma candidum]|uniref:Uncharacterized protein n=1 Tax=Melastoma candidum TaxID=119954 RepID=A0ACB9NW84_9MYRT|nr:hypothetical protein MLD38_025736 [Melastoma candidum]
MPSVFELLSGAVTVTVKCEVVGAQDINLEALAILGGGGFLSRKVCAFLDGCCWVIAMAVGENAGVNIGSSGQDLVEGMRGQKVMGATRNGGYENGVVVANNGVRHIEELDEMLTKGYGSGDGFGVNENGFGSLGYPPRRRNGYQGKRWVNEEQFNTCGQVVDCRAFGDPNSCLRFSFVEFTEEESAQAALGLSRLMVYDAITIKWMWIFHGYWFLLILLHSDDERKMCSRTVDCTNIDRKVTQAAVKTFFESLGGEVQRLRFLGDYQHPTHGTFVEFVVAESAIAALSCGVQQFRTFPHKAGKSIQASGKAVDPTCHDSVSGYPSVGMA